jgi:hypothetical protein
MAIDQLRVKGYMPDWTHLYERMLKVGWHKDRSYRRLQQIVGDVYGPKFRETWTRFMEIYLKGK